MATTDAVAESTDDAAGGERARDVEPSGRELVAAHRETLSELPTSAKLVATVLAHEGELTGTGLAEETRLPARTVRYALRRLEEADVVEAGYAIGDARMRVYQLRT